MEKNNDRYSISEEKRTELKQVLRKRLSLVKDRYKLYLDKKILETLLFDEDSLTDYFSIAELRKIDLSMVDTTNICFANRDISRTNFKIDLKTINPNLENANLSFIDLYGQSTEGLCLNKTNFNDCGVVVDVTKLKEGSILDNCNFDGCFVINKVGSKNTYSEFDFIKDNIVGAEAFINSKH